MDTDWVCSVIRAIRVRNKKYHSLSINRAKAKNGLFLMPFVVLLMA